MRLTRRPAFFFAPVFIALVGFIAAWPNLQKTEWFMEFCGTERWSVKTGTDADSSKVNLNAPQSTTIANMVAFPAQSSPPANNRISPYETTLWVVNATLVEFKSESDEDYHLVLKDASGNTLIAEIPAPHCVGSGSPFLAGVTNARNQFDAKYNATGSFQTVNIPVQVTGIGMFDFAHGQTGAAPNQIELHPVINIIFNPGSGGPPSAPTGLVATAGNAQVGLAWNATSGATSYTVYRATASGAETSYVTGLTTNAYTDTGVTNGTTYYYKVTAVNSGGESTRSAEANATPTSGGVIPPAPTGLSATAGNAQASLAWTASSGATSYNLYRSTSTGAETSYHTGITGTSYTDTSLTNGTTYYYKVTGVNATGESGKSNEASATPAGGGGTTTQLLGNPGFENGSSSPAPWTAASGVIDNGTSEAAHGGAWKAWMDGYGSAHTDTLLQQVAIPAGSSSAMLAFWLHIDTAETTTTAANDTLQVQIRNSSGAVLTTLATYSNLNKNTGFVQKTFDVSAYIGMTIQVYLVATENSSLQTSFVADDFTLNAVSGGGGSPPAAPTGLTATAGNAQVALRWTASSGAASYTVYRSTVSGEEGSYQTGITGISYTDTGAVNGTTYFYEVTAVNANGESAASSEVSATPASGVTIPAAPTGLTATAGNAQVALAWTASSGAASYTLYRSASTGTESSYHNGITGTSYTDTGVTNGVTYFYKVTALNSAGESGKSNEASATPSGGGTPQQLLGNPGFENGSSSPAPWVVASGVIDSGASEAAHSGMWKAWLDGYGSAHTDTLYQQVAIPSNITTATLSFWLHIDSAETSTTTAYDTLKVQVRNSSGTVLATLATYSNLNKATGYAQKSFDLSAYKGQTIQVYLIGVEDATMQTSFVADDFALNVQ